MLLLLLIIALMTPLPLPDRTTGSFNRFKEFLCKIIPLSESWNEKFLSPWVLSPQCSGSPSITPWMLNEFHILKVGELRSKAIKIVMYEPLDPTLCFSGFVNHVGLGDSTALKTLPSGFALGAKHTLIKVGISNASST